MKGRIGDNSIRMCLRKVRRHTGSGLDDAFSNESTGAQRLIKMTLGHQYDFERSTGELCPNPRKLISERRIRARRVYEREQVVSWQNGGIVSHKEEPVRKASRHGTITVADLSSDLSHQRVANLLSVG